MSDEGAEALIEAWRAIPAVDRNAFVRMLEGIACGWRADREWYEVRRDASAVGVLEARIAAGEAAIALLRGPEPSGKGGIGT